MKPSSEPQPGCAPPTTISHSSRQLGFKVAAIVISLLLALLVAEIGLRLLRPSALGSSGRERDFFCHFDPALGWSPLSNIDGAHVKHGRSSQVHQNQFGLRGPDDMQLVRDDGKRRVLVLGDSYIWGFGMSQEKLFSAPEIHQTDQELLNFGVSGYGTDQEYLFYLARGKNFRVNEVVLALTPYNDIANNLGTEQYGYLKPYFTLEGETLVLHTNHIHDSALRNIRNGLSRHCRVYNLVGEVIRNVSYRFKKSDNARDTAEAKREILTAQDVSERDRTGVALTIAILKYLRDAVVMQGAKFTVIFIPYTPHVDQRLPENHPLVPLIAAGLTQAGIDYVEPYPAFVAAELAGAKMFNVPDTHLGPAGQALLARLLTTTNTFESGLNFYSRH